MCCEESSVCFSYEPFVLSLFLRQPSSGLGLSGFLQENVFFEKNFINMFVLGLND